jgi:GNAT superfamily N-acetyltransferase
MPQIIPAGASEHLATLRELFREYAASLETDLCFQGFEKELAELPENYTSGGGLYLAFEEGKPAGCVGFRKLSASVCELKRLYVRPLYRGRGLGRKLALAAIGDARALGYERMRLDTLPSMKRALELYPALGFKPIGAYYPNPVQGAMFLELSLR